MDIKYGRNAVVMWYHGLLRLPGKIKYDSDSCLQFNSNDVIITSMSGKSYRVVVQYRLVAFFPSGATMTSSSGAMSRDTPLHYGQTYSQRISAIQAE